MARQIFLCSVCWIIRKKSKVSILLLLILPVIFRIILKYVNLELENLKFSNSILNEINYQENEEIDSHSPRAEEFRIENAIDENAEIKLESSKQTAITPKPLPTHSTPTSPFIKKVIEQYNILEWGFTAVDLEGHVLPFAAYGDYREKSLIRIVSDGKSCCQGISVQCKYWLLNETISGDLQLILADRESTGAKVVSLNPEIEYTRYYSFCYSRYCINTYIENVIIKLILLLLLLLFKIYTIIIK